MGVYFLIEEVGLTKNAILRVCYGSYAPLSMRKEAEYLLLDSPILDSDLVFSTLAKSLFPNTVTHARIKLVRRTGLKAIRLHNTRHTHANLILQQGIHPKIVSERLEHSTIAATIDTYSHITPGLQEAAARCFDEALITAYNEGVLEVVGS